MAMKCMIQCIRPKQNDIENSHLFTKNCVIDLLSFGAGLDGDLIDDFLDKSRFGFGFIGEGIDG